MAVLNICSKEELTLSDEAGRFDSGVSTEYQSCKLFQKATTSSANDEEAEARRKIIRNKIKAVAKLSRVFNVLREESESIMELKNLMGSSALPSGYLALGAEGIKKGI